MKKSFRLGSAAACFVGLLCQEATGATYYSRPELANVSVGLLETEFRDGFYRGSATVARDSRILYSCAHLIYESGVWAKGYTFHRAWHDQKYPPTRLGRSPRGFHYFTAYVTAARYTNGESNASFANDFTVFYGPTSFGPAARLKESSTYALRSTRAKRILGYPSVIDFTGARGYSYQHSTGWFSKRGYQIREGYHDFYGVSTGSGNSGGGIFLRDSSTGEDLLAGILVSGGSRSAGVVAMDSDTRSLATRAIGSAQSSFTVANASPASLSTSGGTLLRSLPVQEEGEIESLALDLDLSSARSAVPSVYLQSPTGRIRRVAVPADARGTLRIREAISGDSFYGTAASGTWLVRIRSDSPVSFERACLRGTSAD